MTLAVIVAALGAPALAEAQVADTSKKAASTAPADTTVVTFGGFVDTYYAWDFDRPFNFDRAFTTQPARTHEANVNLAFIEAKWTGPRYRGRLALQWGTSVQANYLAEPRIGNISGPSVSQFIQEAVVGYQVAPTVWIDAGIFLSHIGLETWISRDNLTYTRSIVADFSPYYESGAKATWAATQKLTATFVLVNGWQNISAENSTPGGGIRLDYATTPKLTLSYDNYIGNFAPDQDPVRLRFYHDLFAQYNPGERLQFAAQYSLGTQSRSTADGVGTASWWGFTTIAKYHFTKTLAAVGRVEYFSDPSQVVIVTTLPESFKTTGASIGVDVNFKPPVLWRTELRGFRSTERVWPLNTFGDFGRNDSFIVTSLALTY